VVHIAFVILALACFGLSAVSFGFGRILGNRENALRLLGLGTVFETLDLLVQAFETGNLPVASLGQSLAFLSWLVALSGLVLIVRFRMRIIGAFVAVTALVTLLAASLTSNKLALPAALRSAWLPVHVSFAFLGYALFVLAASVSAIYLVEEHRLKAKRPVEAGEEGAPSLEKLDRINYRLLGWGFAMLSLAIISGAFWAEHAWGRFWSWEPQELWSALTWLLYAGLLESRLAAGWRGRRAAALTIAIFTVLVGSFLGVNLLSPGKHGGSFG
jgi:cytochrome c-type biogenesis protein CcsB